MSFEASIDQTEKAPSSTAVSGHSAESRSGFSAFSQRSSEALPGVDPGCGRDRDFVAELTSRWSTCEIQRAKVALVDEFFEITFESTEEELEQVFGNIVIIEFDGRYTSSQQLGHIIDQFKKIQHHINHSNDKSCFNERDGKLHVSWPLPDGVPKDYKYPNPRYPKRGPLTFDQPEAKIPLDDSITETSEAEAGSMMSQFTGPPKGATFVPKGYIRGKDYVKDFVKEWNNCDGEDNEKY